jgi:hypothetical protein
MNGLVPVRDLGSAEPGAPFSTLRVAIGAPEFVRSALRADSKP